jgi:hypothetical protein
MVQPAAPHRDWFAGLPLARLVTAASTAATSTLTPPESISPPPFITWVTRMSHGVALRVAFERQTLKPVFHLIGYRLWV